ncbi:MAG: glycoside hydrolase family 3 protein [Actinomycetota bacterium]|nr:glycoside hydrolase family 3 protein [Actinomycetota bacterium]
MRTDRAGARAGRVALVALALTGPVAACGGPRQADASRPSSSGSEGPAQGAGPATSSAPTGPGTTSTSTASGSAAAGGQAACVDGATVAGWSLSRRAALLVVVPVLSADPQAVTVAVQAGAGGVLLIGPQTASTLPSDLRPLRQDASPAPLVMVDQEGGGVQRLGPPVTQMPWPRQMASTMTPAAVEALARQVGGQMRSLGVDVDLAPVLDLDGGPTLSARDADGPRSFSADAATAAAYGAAFRAGMAEAGVLAVVKHFPGLGGASGNTDYGPAATAPYVQLQSAGLVPFEQAIRSGARAVMVANASVPGLSSVPASLSPAVITGLLRQKLGFGGLVLTDSLSAGAIRAAGYTVPSAAAAAVEAGADMVLFGSTLTPSDTAALAPPALGRDTAAIVAAMVSAVRSGRLPEARLDQAVLHVLAAQGATVCPGS